MKFIVMYNEINGHIIFEKIKSLTVRVIRKIIIISCHCIIRGTIKLLKFSKYDIFEDEHELYTKAFGKYPLLKNKKIH